MGTLPHGMLQTLKALALLLLLFFSSSFAIHAQDSRCLHRAVIANVFGEKDAVVSDLTAADFRAKFRGADVPIHAATFERAAKRTVVLFDASGSMEAIYRRRDLLTPETIKTLFAGIPGGNTYAFGTFAEDLKVLVPFTNSYPSLEAQASALQVNLKTGKEISGRTALWSSILKASDLFGAPAMGDSILLFTDTGDNRSDHFRNEVQEMLIVRRIRLFVIDPFEIDSLRAEADEEDAQNMIRAAKATGGFAAFMNINSASDFEGALAFVQRRIQYFYRIELELPHEVDKPRNLDLKFADEKAAAKKKLYLEYQHTLVPCKAEQARNPN